jgi:hypothetical protein
MSMAPTSTMGGMSMSMPSAPSGASAGMDMGGMEGMDMTCKSTPVKSCTHHASRPVRC